LEPIRVQTKQWAFASLKDCLSSGQRWLSKQERREGTDYPPIVLSSLDEDLLRCLEGTTERETVTGQTQWDSPSRHMIDMMLCTVIGANRLSGFGNENEAPSWLDELGWTGGDGKGMRMPWEPVSVGGLYELQV